MGTSDWNANKVRTPQKKGKGWVCAGSFLLKLHLWFEGGEKKIMFEVM